MLKSVVMSRELHLARTNVKDSDNVLQKDVTKDVDALHGLYPQSTATGLGICYMLSQLP
jgi:hypothetical protein